MLGASLSGPERFTVRPRIGLIGHVPALYPELTLEENLGFAATLIGSSRSEVRTVLAAVGLEEAAGRRTDRCSHGMQRRAEFAREMLRAPDLLLLDEPHSALDPDAVALVAHLVQGVVSRGGAAVVVSHDRDRIAPMVGRSVELMAGSLT